jgi:hypothetical protein
MYFIFSRKKLKFSDKQPIYIKEMVYIEKRSGSMPVDGVQGGTNTPVEQRRAQRREPAEEQAQEQTQRAEETRTRQETETNRQAGGVDVTT